MAECDHLDMLKSEEIIAKVTKFLQERCRCSHCMKGSQCCEQFSKEAVLSNLNNCLELSHGEFDLVILANIQACMNSEIIGEKRKQSSRSSFLYLNRPICKDMFLSLLSQCVSVRCGSAGIFELCSNRKRISQEHLH